MSGTSADGIDIALVRIAPARQAEGRADRRARPRAPGANLRLRLLAHRAFPFPKALRHAILAAMNAQSTSAAELARLNWRLGQVYAEAVCATIESSGIRPALIGCHGQTIYHQGVPAPYAGRAVACTWQLGEPALLAAATGLPVVSNFRPADMAAGGQGAPLVPLLDAVLFAHPGRARILQNIGGIGNLTLVPPGGALDAVIAFDTGPGNMVIDALMHHLFNRSFDRNGRTAARGQILDSVLVSALREKFFRVAPPKSAGREQFGADYATRFSAACLRLSSRAEDAVATATALTAESIRHSVEQWVLPRTAGVPLDFIVSGGGARNATLMEWLRQRLEPLGCTVSTSDATGLPIEAKEAAAFALLAYQTWNRRPGNVPSATGASRPAILGQITYV